MVNWPDPLEDAKWSDKHNRSGTFCESESARLLVPGRKKMGVYATNGRIFQGSGGVGRLWDGRGRTNIALIYSSPDFNINLAQQSHTALWVARFSVYFAVWTSSFRFSGMY